MTPQNPMLELKDELRWYGQKILIGRGLHLGNASEFLPKFRRDPFGENEYLDVIVRQPDETERRAIPVATVSKRYALIQHIELLRWITKGLREVGLAAEAVPVQLWMTEYGERLRLWFVIQKQSFDPGDGHEVVLAAECFNSVDKSCALEMRVLWLRLVCSNGLVMKEKSRIRKIHDLAWMNRDDPAEFFAGKIDCCPGTI
jgi:Domain of unknown function (DUF932)